jgi:soluble lytic murein transglycosylase-like protein
MRVFDETMRARARTQPAEWERSHMSMKDGACALVARWRGAGLPQRRHLLQLGIGAVLLASMAAAPRIRDRVQQPGSPPEYDAAHDMAARSNAVFDALDEYLRDHQVDLAAATYAQRFRITTGLARSIYRAADAEDISPDVAFGLVRAESSFRTRAVSRAGAVGLTQVLPSTGRWIAPGTTRRDLLDPETNLRVGFRYLRYLMDKYDGDEALALTAYNRGPGTVDRHLQQGRNPDNGYVEMVLTGRSRKHSNLMNARFGRRS